MKFILLKQFTMVNMKLKVGIEVGHSSSITVLVPVVAKSENI